MRLHDRPLSRGHTAFRLEPNAHRPPAFRLFPVIFAVCLALFQFKLDVNCCRSAVRCNATLPLVACGTFRLANMGAAGSVIDPSAMRREYEKKSAESVSDEELLLHMKKFIISAPSGIHSLLDSNNSGMHSCVWQCSGCPMHELTVCVHSTRHNEGDAIAYQQQR